MTGVWLWARSEIRDGWRSLIVVGVLVAVVIGSVLALAAGASRAGSAPDRFAESTDLAELIVFVGGQAPAELVDEIAADPRVERVVVSTVAKIGAGRGRPGVQQRSSARTIRCGGYGRPFLVSGRYPEPGSTDEILVSERGALREGIVVGDRVPLTALQVPRVRGGEHRRRRRRRHRPPERGPRRRPGWPAHRPRRTDARRRSLAARAEQPGTILSLHVADGVDRARSPPTCRSTVGALGNASDQEVDIESVAARGDAAARCVAPRSPPSPPSPARSSWPKRCRGTSSGVRAMRSCWKPSAWAAGSGSSPR